jgi:hypothetical protein
MTYTLHWVINPLKSISYFFYIYVMELHKVTESSIMLYIQIIKFSFLPFKGGAKKSTPSTKKSAGWKAKNKRLNKVWQPWKMK